MHQLTIKTTAQQADDIADFLSELGALAVTFADAEDQPVFQIEPDETPLWDEVAINALFEKEAQCQAALASTRNEFSSLTLTANINEVIEQDWVRVTQQQFQPQCFGSSLWICPAWEDTSALEGTIVRIDPGLAFGTGTHPTTAMCLEWLANNPPVDQVVIDYGCGSGILALAALALGAKEVWATDHDEQALEATHNNAQLNDFVNTENLNIISPAKMPDIQADTLLANILANPLISLAPALTNLTKNTGSLILSGLLKEEAEKVFAAYSSDFSQVNFIGQDEWGLVELKKK